MNKNKKKVAKSNLSSKKEKSFKERHVSWILINTLRSIWANRFQVISLLLIVFLASTVVSLTRSSLDRIDAAYSNLVKKSNLDDFVIPIDDVSKNLNQNNPLANAEYNNNGFFAGDEYDQLAVAAVQKQLSLSSKTSNDYQYRFDWSYQQSREISYVSPGTGQITKTFRAVMNSNTKSNDVDKLVLYSGSEPKSNIVDNKTSDINITLSNGYASHNDIKIGDSICLFASCTPETEMKVSGLGVSANFMYPLTTLSAILPNQHTQAILYSDPNTFGYSTELKHASLVFDNNVKSEISVKVLNYIEDPNLGGEVLGITSNADRERNILCKFIDKNVDKTKALSRINELLNEYFLQVGSLNSGNKFAYSNQDPDYFYSARYRAFFTSKSGYSAGLIALTLVLISVSAILLSLVITKQVQATRSQIAILKALGYRRTVMVMSYLMWPIICSVAAGIIGFIIGLVIQPTLVSSFFNYFSFSPGKFNFDWSSLAIVICGGFSVLSIISLSTAAYFTRGKPIELLKPLISTKTSRASMVIARLFAYRNFMVRLKYSLLIRSFGKVSLAFSAICVSTILVSIALLLPRSLSQMQSSTFSHNKIKTLVDYQIPAYNSPYGQYRIVNSNHQNNISPTYSDVMSAVKNKSASAPKLISEFIGNDKSNPSYNGLGRGSQNNTMNYSVPWKDSPNNLVELQYQYWTSLPGSWRNSLVNMTWNQFKSFTAGNNSNVPQICLGAYAGFDMNWIDIKQITAVDSNGNNTTYFYYPPLGDTGSDQYKKNFEILKQRKLISKFKISDDHYIYSVTPGNCIEQSVLQKAPEFLRQRILSGNNFDMYMGLVPYNPDTAVLSTHLNFGVDDVENKQGTVIHNYTNDLANQKTISAYGLPTNDLQKLDSVIGLKDNHNHDLDSKIVHNNDSNTVPIVINRTLAEYLKISEGNYLTFNAKRPELEYSCSDNTTRYCPFVNKVLTPTEEINPNQEGWVFKSNSAMPTLLAHAQSDMVYYKFSARHASIFNKLPQSAKDYLQTFGGTGNEFWNANTNELRMFQPKSLNNNSQGISAPAPVLPSGMSLLTNLHFIKQGNEPINFGNYKFKVTGITESFDTPKIFLDKSFMDNQVLNYSSLYKSSNNSNLSSTSASHTYTSVISTICAKSVYNYSGVDGFTNEACADPNGVNNVSENTNPLLLLFPIFNSKFSNNKTVSDLNTSAITYQPLSDYNAAGLIGVHYNGTGEEFPSVSTFAKSGTVQLFNHKIFTAQISQLKGIMMIVVYLFIIIAILISIIMIAITANMVVNENTRIYAVFKVMGYYNRQIARVTMAIYVLPLVLGFVIGYAISWYIMSFALSKLAQNSAWVMPLYFNFGYLVATIVIVGAIFLLSFISIFRWIDEVKPLKILV